jgi:tRNA(Ile)-lysidine synthase
MLGKFRRSVDLLLCSSDTPLILAVSGGSDSMALALLARGAELEFTAVTVNHALRPESLAEAAQVAKWMEARGIPHHILHWKHGGVIRGNLQQAARFARYDLLAEYCGDEGGILVAHTEDDQAETIALRQARKSGPVGLAGMQVRTRWNGVSVLRPLLEFTREELRDYLHVEGQEWIDDPSNEKVEFDRIRIRKELAMDPERRAGLLALGREMARERTRLEAEFAEFMGDDRLPLALDRSAFLSLSPETAIYALSRLLRSISGRHHPPRYRELGRLYAVIRDASRGKKTLGKCLIEWDENQLSLTLEYLPKPLVRGAFSSV